MERYKIIETISEQEYGMIAKVINLQTKEPAILKILKKRYFSWQECMNTREIKALRLLQHPNIITLQEILKENDQIICVYEPYDESLFDYYQHLRDSYQELRERQIKEIMFQIVSGVHYMHGMKYFHRDLCPETICVISHGNSLFLNSRMTVKISAFNVARDIQQRNPAYTDYITTRWYRAPEQLVHSTHYTHKIDIWAIGCIMAELFLLGPIFNGVSEHDQLQRMVKVFGTPKDLEFPEFFSYASATKFSIPYAPPTELSTLLPTASAEAIDLLKSIFKYNALQRPSCEQILKHPFFAELHLVPPEYDTPTNIIQKTEQRIGSERITHDEIKSSDELHSDHLENEESSKTEEESHPKEGKKGIVKSESEIIRPGKIEQISQFSQYVQKHQDKDNSPQNSKDQE